MIIGIPIYDKVDLLDVCAAREIFYTMTSYTQTHYDIWLLAPDCNPVKSRDGMTLTPQKTFDEVPNVDLLWVPGADGSALKILMKDQCLLDYLVSCTKNAQWVTSVCEGAMLLAAAGLLDGYEATTHWAFIPCLQAYPDVKVVQGFPRFVVDRNRVTGGGISSGLDEAFKIVELLEGYEVAQQVQQLTQYDPCPPVASVLTPATSCPLD
jgi:cyclohexyl-isocyanide hydratase